MDKKTIENIKKELYKSKPDAFIRSVDKHNIKYYAMLDKYEDSEGNTQVFEQVSFAIPIQDLGDATFTSIMPAHQLIRWLVTE